ncbi:unnamed protein product [Nezara viridula]|uniref:Uncharacterized protein n=1 Tax=Nezara viridula TaxID=85310 RepID=A0A9P0HUC4_NEZVI|nr:unnamed protein product [Nezara viridula]
MMENGRVSLKRGIQIEKYNSKKKIRFHKTKHHGRLLKNVRLKSVLNQVTSVNSSSCTSSRVPSPQIDDVKKCNRVASLGEDVKLTCYPKTRISSCHEGADIMSDDLDITDSRSKFLAYLAFSRFLKNALERKREGSESQEVQLTFKNAQVDNLKLQVVSLKSLLSSDQRIMASSIREITLLKNLLAALQEEFNTVKAEKEILEEKTELLSEALSRTLTELNNEKNNYILARSEAIAFEAQLGKEREKIAQLKQDNKSLLSKLEQELPGSSSSDAKKLKPKNLMLELD